MAVERVNKERLERLSPDVRHQGVVAVGSAVAFRDLDEVLEGVAQKGKDPFLLLLDELQDPQNIGALIRSANAAGVDAVIVPQRRKCSFGGGCGKDFSRCFGT